MSASGLESLSPSLFSPPLGPSGSFALGTPFLDLNSVPYSSSTAEKGFSLLRCPETSALFRRPVPTDHCFYFCKQILVSPTQSQTFGDTDMSSDVW